jgi:hypothetical protein
MKTYCFHEFSRHCIIFAAPPGQKRWSRWPLQKNLYSFIVDEEVKPVFKKNLAPFLCIFLSPVVHTSALPESYFGEINGDDSYDCPWQDCRE